MNQSEESEAARRRARQELDAAGVPRWAQQGSPQQNEAGSGRYYIWVENGTLQGRLLTRPDCNEATAVKDLLKQCDDVLAQDESDCAPPPADLTRLVDLVILRPNGMASGRLGPDTDPLSLKDLINYARNELARRQ